MRHFEVHYVHTVTEAQSIESLGLIRFEMEEFCEHCGEPVAFVEEDFEPCGVVLDEDYTYLLCAICILPILNPGVELF